MAGASRSAMAPIVRGLPLKPQDRRSAFRCGLSDRGIENRLHPRTENHDVPLRRNSPAPLTQAIHPACPPPCWHQVADETPSVRVLTPVVDGGKGVTCRHRNDVVATVEEE